MSKIGQSVFNSSEVLAQLRDMQSKAKHSMSDSADTNKSNTSFLEHLKAGLSEVNSTQKEADKMAVELASGKSQSIHETMLASTNAELSFNLMVQIRNKVLEAYQEVMRMQI